MNRTPAIVMAGLLTPAALLLTAVPLSAAPASGTAQVRTIDTRPLSTPAANLDLAAQQPDFAEQPSPGEDVNRPNRRRQAPPAPPKSDTAPDETEPPAWCRIPELARDYRCF
ncbi:hypothetical protein AB0I35_30755 [Nocardia sp. NPDC050378]|uniref:hypothetical protein n=1 Tax=Nocardia sp. NPDC050378 TaxID=3155400 RepID=UPI0033D5D516